MDVAAASISMKSAQTMQAVSIRMASKVMDLQKQTGQQLVEMMQSATPNFGHKLNIRI